MSATNAPFGLRPAFHPTGLDRAQALAGGIATTYNTGILKGQPVKYDTNGNIVVAAAGDALSAHLPVANGRMLLAAVRSATSGPQTLRTRLVPTSPISIATPTSFMKFRLTARWPKPQLATKPT
jgi:hypothetical protein